MPDSLLECKWLLGIRRKSLRIAYKSGEIWCGANVALSNPCVNKLFFRSKSSFFERRPHFCKLRNLFSDLNCHLSQRIICIVNIVHLLLLLFKFLIINETKLIRFVCFAISLREAERSVWSNYGFITYTGSPLSLKGLHRRSCIHFKIIFKILKRYYKHIFWKFYIRISVCNFVTLIELKFKNHNFDIRKIQCGHLVFSEISYAE